MKRWDCNKGNFVENKLVDSFLEEIIDVCEKHGFSISHEDGQGSFEVVRYQEGCVGWLLGANVDMRKEVK